MTNCCVFGCNNNYKNSKETLHRFPARDKEPERYKAWKERINRKNFVPTNRAHLVCSAHFTADDFQHLLKEQLLPHEKIKRLLKKSSVPSLFLGGCRSEMEKTRSKKCLDKKEIFLDLASTSKADNIIEFIDFKTERKMSFSEPVKSEIKIEIEEKFIVDDGGSIGESVDEEIFPDEIKIEPTEDLRKIHEVGVRHKCGICERTFSYPYFLKRHMTSHTDERPHKCEICEKAFRISQHLSQHMKCHTNEKSHKCDICKKAFRTSQNLNQHMLCHTKDKPHKCEICEKVFPRYASLKRHVLCHTDEKPHKCEICKTSFRYSQDLKHHLMSHVGTDTSANVKL